MRTQVILQGFDVNPSSLVGYRLREERERLGLKQSEIAELAGVSREMWGRYERGALPGSEVLIALASIKSPEKLDVLYVITGQRSAPVDEAQTLPPRERALIDNYRACDDDGKRVIEGAARLGSQSKAA